MVTAMTATTTDRQQWQERAERKRRTMTDLYSRTARRDGKYRSMPEMVDGHGWVLEEAAQAQDLDGARAQVNLEKRVIQASFLGIPEARFVQLHEQCHVAWTPHDMTPHAVLCKLHDEGHKHVTIDMIQAVEDSRVNDLGYMAGCHILQGTARLTKAAPMVRRAVEKQLKAGRFMEAVHMMIGMLAVTFLTRSRSDRAQHGNLRRHYTGMRFKRRSPLHASFGALFESIWLALRKRREDEGRDGFEWTEETLRQLDKVLEQSRATEERLRDEERERCEIGVGELARLLRMLPGGVPLPPGMLDDGFAQSMGIDRCDVENAKPWGDMRIARPHLSVRHKVPFKNKQGRWCSADTGTVLRYPQNWFTTEKRVFGHRRRTFGGTVLIDASGSMSVTLRDVYAMMLEAPALTVAMYSGCGGSGTLTVIADGGRRISPDDMNLVTQSGGNVIDGPALVWLAGQRGPRVWISDGWVTGRNDMQWKGNLSYCNEVCGAGDIVRVPGSAQCAAILRSRRTGKAPVLYP
jgi:hypothetical protein